MPMDYKEALAYIDGVHWLGSKPGLERILTLLGKLGNPQKDLKYIHVAGTNGKGSCAAMAASVLKAAGYRTGLFTSPYLFRFTERMQINSREIPEEALAALVTEIQPLADAMDDHPTEFELMTAAALLWYKRELCDIVVLEVGLGGRFDATNVIQAPEAAVIMNIGLDHTAILGDTVEQIAGEKAGIIKPGCPVVLYQQQESVQAVIREKCRAADAPLYIVDFAQIAPEFDSLEGQVFTYRGEPYAIPLLGEHQLRNAAVVIELVQVLRGRGWRIEQDALEHGLYSVTWPARFEPVHEDPYVIVDGGHNPQCAQAVTDGLLRYFPHNRRILLVGVLADKDYESLFEILDKAADAYVCVTPNSERALSAEALAAYLGRFGKPVTACGTIRQGIDTALAQAGQNDMICIVGSLYMAGEARDYFLLK